MSGEKSVLSACPVMPDRLLWDLTLCFSTAHEGRAFSLAADERWQHVRGQTQTQGEHHQHKPLVFSRGKPAPLGHCRAKLDQSRSGSAAMEELWTPSRAAGSCGARPAQHRGQRQRSVSSLWGLPWGLVPQPPSPTLEAIIITLRARAVAGVWVHLAELYMNIKRRLKLLEDSSKCICKVK